MMCAKEADEDTKYQPVSLDSIYEDIMSDPTITPMMYTRSGFMMPIIDEEGNKRSWQKILKNLH